MKKILLSTLAALATLAFYIPTFAANECVPSMTVEEAQAQYQRELAALDAHLDQAYSEASLQHEQQLAAALDLHQQRAAEIKARYEIEIKDIQARLELEWQKEMDAAVQRYNEALALNADQYTFETHVLTANYNHQTARAQAEYQTRVQQLAADYNSAVCAGQ